MTMSKSNDPLGDSEITYPVADGGIDLCSGIDLCMRNSRSLATPFDIGTPSGL